MAKKSNKRPGQVSTSSKKDTAMAMKRKSSDLNHTKFAKFVFILMILAFVGVPVAGLVAWLIQIL